MIVSKIGETAKTITLGWIPVPCLGYMFLADGRRVSHTWDPNVAQVRFAKGAAEYKVVPLLGGEAGVYPPPAVGPPVPAAIAGQGYDLVFRDEFDTLDYGPSNTWGPVWYSASQPSDAVLLIEPSVVRVRNRASWSSHPRNVDICTSHVSNTQGTYFRFGYFEARIRASATLGTWPGVWLFSKAHRQGTSSASSLVSEIDIMEGYTSYRNAQGTVVLDSDDWHPTVHRNTGSLYGVPDTYRTTFLTGGPDWVAGWVTYGCLWTPTELRFYVNDSLAFTCPPYDSTPQDMFLLVSAYWDANPTSGYPTFPSSDIWVDCDWVRVWQNETGILTTS